MLSVETNHRLAWFEKSIEMLNATSNQGTLSETPTNVGEDRVLRILIVAHSAILYSGVAEVVRLIFAPLIRRYTNRYIVEQVGLLHLSAVTSPPWPITPTQIRRNSRGDVELDPHDLYGQLTVPRVIARFMPDIVFAHSDPQAVLFLARLRSEPACRWKLVLYVNFDGVPIPSGFEELLLADQLVTLSEFSRSAYLSSLGKDSAPSTTVDVLYCPSDTDRFMPAADPVAIRSENRPPWMPQSAFVIGWVGRNQWRKQTWIPFELISRLRFGRYRLCRRCGRVSIASVSNSLQAFPGCAKCDFVEATEMRNIFLWMHLPTGCEPGPWRLQELERTYGVVSGQDIHYTDGCSPTAHLAPDAMPVLYQCFDALLALSGGEGFGLPAWEAMATEVPVIYTNYSSHGEFLGRARAGVGVGGALQPEPSTGILRMIANLDECIAAVRRLCLDPEHAKILGRRGREFVGKYDKCTMAEEWHRRFGDVLERPPAKSVL